MPDVAVQKSSEQKANEKAPAKQNQGWVSRPSFWERDISSWPSPSEFFSNPFAMMRRLSEEMDRTFGRYAAREEGESFWSPAVEVSTSGGQLKVHAELPGLKPENVHVEVANDQLVLQGERKSEHEEKKEGTYRSERRYGRFYRSIPLPEGANVEQAKAQFNNGVLEITLPIPEQKSNRREIPISSK